MAVDRWDLHSDVEELKRLVLKLPDDGPPEEMLTAIDEAHAVLSGVRASVVVERLQESSAELKPNPAVAAAVAASQSMLERLDDRGDTRLLAAAEMAAYARRSRNWPAEAARSGRLIPVFHAGKTFYPAFQLDPDTRTVRRWVAPMLQFLTDMELDGRDLAIWAATRSRLFEDDLPARNAGDDDFYLKAVSAIGGL